MTGEVRSKRGWLRSEYLRRGYREQHAVIVDGVKHAVELLFDPTRGGYVTTYRIDDASASVIEAHEWQVASNLVLAREKFDEFTDQIARLTLDKN